MAGKRNGNGRNGGEGIQPDVPRWVRVLFDKHDRMIEELKRNHDQHVEEMRQMKEEHEERMAEHEKRMAAHERRMERLERNDEIERQRTRTLVQELARVDEERKRDRVAFLGELKTIHESLVKLNARMDRPEKPGNGK